MSAFKGYPQTGFNICYLRFVKNKILKRYFSFLSFVMLRKNPCHPHSKCVAHRP